MSGLTDMKQHYSSAGCKADLIADSIGLSILLCQERVCRSSLNSQASKSWGGQLHELVFHLSTALCMQEFAYGRPHSTPLIHLCGILEFAANGAGFQRPARQTPTISAFICLQRLLFLEYALPHQLYHYLRRPASVESEYLWTSRQVQVRYMCEGSAMPLRELTRLLSYGREMLKSEQSSPSFDGVDDQIVHVAEHSLYLAYFRQFAWSGLDTATDRCNKLMSHWAPTISLEQARDVMSNGEPSYSWAHQSS